MNRAGLWDDFFQAFAGLRRDPEQSIHQAQLCDRGMSANPASAAEWRVAEKIDRESSWLDVPDKSIDECDAALSFFSSESWRFYIPAYIRRSLERFHPPQPDERLLLSVLFHLTLRDASNSYTLERYRSLDALQHRAIAHFLRLVEHEALALVEETNDYYEVYDAAKNALHSYWAVEPRGT